MPSIDAVEKESVSEIRVRQLMVRWQEWRDERRKETLAQLGYGETFLKRYLDDMPSAICTLCRGRNHDCQLCGGSGKIDLDPEVGKINPANIRSTHKGMDDEVSARIDRIMCNLRGNPKTLGYYLILLQEYTRVGTQQIKADRIHLSYGAYKVKLHRAHRHIQDGIYIQV